MEVAQFSGSFTFGKRRILGLVKRETRDALSPRYRNAGTGYLPCSLFRKSMGKGDAGPKVDALMICNASDYGMVSSEEELSVSKIIPTIADQPQSVLAELTMLSLPAIAGQAIEPFAQLMETTYIGRLGSLELASVGVSISIFNIISKVSSMHIPAQGFLALREIGAPAVVVAMSIQGIFRGFKDTKTLMLYLGLGNLSAIFLFPLLMYYFGLGVNGAAISTVVSQYIVTCLMIWYLGKKTVLSFPNMKKLQFGGYLRYGGFLIGRTLAAVMTITLSTSMAAHQGPSAMAAHQICLQIWLYVSLLSDAQGSSGQALIASSFAKHDYSRVREIVFCALKTGLFTVLLLAVLLGLSLGYLPTLFTKDTVILTIVRSVAIYVSVSQPFNALAYIFDGLHYGISDFSYAAWSMMILGVISSIFLIYVSPIMGLSGIWLGLTVFMGLRAVAGLSRLLSKSGPWFFL